MQKKDNIDTEAAPEAVETRDIGDAIDLLCRAMSLNHLMFMAGEGLAIHDTREAITTGADVISDVLVEVKAILYANLDKAVQS